jgi:hypothetical protein
MAQIERTFYIHAHFNTDGQFTSFNIDQYKMDPGMGQYGMWILLRQEKLTFEVPDDMQAINIQAAAELDKFILEEQGKHQMKLMKLQAAANAMRGLMYQQVLDPLPGHKRERGDMQQFGDDNRHDDDTPF